MKMQFLLIGMIGAGLFVLTPGAGALGRGNYDSNAVTGGFSISF
jgi:hypothetical protein